MSETVKIVIATTIANALVTWGVMSTKLDWLRRDFERLEHRVELIELRSVSKEAK